MKKLTGIFLVFMGIFILLTGLTHTVKKGDTLWDISEHYYGDPFLWPIIYEANKNIIQDPHWIYPDQMFTIPPYTGEETKVEIPETTTATTETTGTATKPIVSAAPEEKITPPPEEVSQPKEKVKVVSVLEAPTGKKKKNMRKITVIAPTNFSFATSLAYSAGYITKEERFNIGKISYTPEEIKKTEFVANDKVAINRGIEDGIKEGDIYTVYRMGDAVYDPITDNYLGRVVEILGDIRVLETKKHTAVAIILSSFEPIRPGDLFMKRIIPSLPTGEPKPFISNITGYLVYSKGISGIIKPFDIVYVRTDSIGKLQLGDILLLYRENILYTESGTNTLPIIPLGKIQIINLKGENTATGYITSIMGHMDIKLGDKFRLVGRIGE